MVEITKQIEKQFNNTIIKIRNIKKKYTITNQYCKYCGKEMHYDYHIPEENWLKIPSKYHNKVLCIHCFCELYPSELSKINLKLY